MIFDGENAFARRSVCRFNGRLCPSVLHAIFNKTLPPTRPRMPSAAANVCGGVPFAANGAVPPACAPCDACTGVASRRPHGDRPVALRSPAKDRTATARHGNALYPPEGARAWARRSLTRVRSFAELENHPPRSGGMVQSDSCMAVRARHCGNVRRHLTTPTEVGNCRLLFVRITDAT